MVLTLGENAFTKRKNKGKVGGKIPGGEVDLKTVLWHVREHSAAIFVRVGKQHTVIWGSRHRNLTCNKEATGDKPKQYAPEASPPSVNCKLALEALPPLTNRKGKNSFVGSAKTVTGEPGTDTVRLGKHLL